MNRVVHSQRAPMRRLQPLIRCSVVLACAALLGCADWLTGPHAHDVAVLWRHAIDWQGASPSIGDPGADAHAAYIETAMGVEAFEPAFGATLWNTVLNTSPHTPTARALIQVNGTVYAPREGSVIALDARSGAVRWRAALDSARGGARAAADDRAIYVAARDNRLHALAATDGHELWVADVGATAWAPYGGFMTGTAVSGDTVYASGTHWERQYGGVSTGVIVALDRNTGAELWRYETPDSADDVMSMAVDGRIIVANDLYGTRILGIDRFTGREAWRVDGDMQYFGASEAPAILGDTAYIGSNDTNVYAIVASTGRLLWRTNVGGSISGFALCGGRVVATLFEFVILDRHSGQRLATLLDGDTEFPVGGVAAAGGRAFAAGAHAAYGIQCDRLQ